MFTILGSGGFIGRELAASLRAAGEAVHLPGRDQGALFDRPLGDVVYAIGVAGASAARRRPFATVEAHVCLLRRVLESADYRSLLYLSSTRIYGVGTSSPALEGQPLRADPSDPHDLYSISKIMGEALCHAAGRDDVRIARLANVYGINASAGCFLPMVLESALREGRVVLQSALDSAKDYVSLGDVVRLLPEIARRGTARTYNVASGRNVSHGEILAAVAATTPLTVEVVPGAPTVITPTISIALAQQDLGFAPGRSLIDDVPELIAHHASRRTS